MIAIRGKSDNEYDSKAKIIAEAEKKQANIYKKHLSIMGVSIFNSSYMSALRTQKREDKE